jgi:hypothetical protein
VRRDSFIERSHRAIFRLHRGGIDGQVLQIDGRAVATLLAGVARAQKLDA